MTDKETAIVDMKTPTDEDLNVHVKNDSEFILKLPRGEYRLNITYRGEYKDE